MTTGDEDLDFGADLGCLPVTDEEDEDDEADNEAVFCVRDKGAGAAPATGTAERVARRGGEGIVRREWSSQGGFVSISGTSDE